MYEKNRIQEIKSRRFSSHKWYVPKNKGILCRVTYICDDVIWISTVNGEPNFHFDDYYTDWSEVTFRAVNVISIKTD